MYNLKVGYVLSKKLFDDVKLLVVLQLLPSVKMNAKYR